MVHWYVVLSKRQARHIWKQYDLAIFWYCSHSTCQWLANFTFLYLMLFIVELIRVSNMYYAGGGANFESQLHILFQISISGNSYYTFFFFLKMQLIFLFYHSVVDLLYPLCKNMIFEHSMQCFFPQNALDFIRTPYFILNSAYDIYQVILNCHVGHLVRPYDCHFWKIVVYTLGKEAVYHACSFL